MEPEKTLFHRLPFTRAYVGNARALFEIVLCLLNDQGFTRTLSFTYWPGSLSCDGWSNTADAKTERGKPWIECLVQGLSRFRCF